MIVQVAKLIEDAELPVMSSDMAVGYDLKMLNSRKLSNVPIWEVTHGIAVVPPEGFYFELVARSSLHKEGYMLANSVGIIDPDYRGDIIAKAYKFREDAKPLVKGESYFQLILHRREVVTWSEISIDELDKTSRGAGGFGSTKPFANKTVQAKPQNQRRATSKPATLPEETLDEQFDEEELQTTPPKTTPQRRTPSKPKQQQEQQEEEQFEEEQPPEQPPKRAYTRRTPSKPLESEPQQTRGRPSSKPVAEEDNFDEECEEQQPKTTRSRAVPSRQSRSSR